MSCVVCVCACACARVCIDVRQWRCTLWGGRQETARGVRNAPPASSVPSLIYDGWSRVADATITNGLSLKKKPVMLKFFILLSAASGSSATSTFIKASDPK